VAFDRLIDELCADPEVERAQMMGHPVAKARGSLFAIGLGDDLVLKLGAERVDELIAAGKASPFYPGGKNRRWREWAQLPPPDDGWLELAEEAKDRL
jgi:hypothetical protein